MRCLQSVRVHLRGKDFEGNRVAEDEANVSIVYDLTPVGGRQLAVPAEAPRVGVVHSRAEDVVVVPNEPSPAFGDQRRSEAASSRV